MNNTHFQHLLMLVMVVASAAAMAQNYPESGDTIYGSLPEKYYAPWWVYDDWTLTSTDVVPHACSQGDSDMCFSYAWGTQRSYTTRMLTTDTTLKVVGLAGVSLMRGGTYYYNLQASIIEDREPLLQEYFVLAERNKGNDTLDIVRQVPWHFYDPHRTLAVPATLCDLNTNYANANCVVLGDSVLYYNIREYYFDEPYYVTDTFFVGGTQWSCAYGTNELENVRVYHDTFPDYGVIHTGFFALNRNLSHFFLLVERCPFHQETYVTNASSTLGCYMTFQPMGSIDHRNFPLFMLIFPIIEIPEPPAPDTFSCPAPTGLGVMDRDTGAVWLQWQAHPEQSAWTVGYCEAGLDFDSVASMMDCSVHELVRVAGLRPNTEYEFRVQALCDHNDSLFLSDWSAPLLVTTDTVPSAPDTTGILLPDAPGEVLSVEYFDLLGRPLAQPPARGFYIRRETTTNGTSTRKIVRQ